MKSATARCPTCKTVSKKDGNNVFPFCCERCQLVDLGRWLSEEYRVPAEERDATGGGIESLTPQTDDGHHN